jgi:signal transduction histidine kinase
MERIETRRADATGELAPGSYVVLEVRDNGEGIHPAALSKISDCGANCAVRADLEQMVWIFEELFRNSLRFRSGDPLRIEISAAQSYGAWLISVLDNAAGIPPGQLERAFRPFQ